MIQHLFKTILFYLKFSNRNLWRRRNRTILLGVSFTILTLVIIFFIGFAQGLSRQMIGKAKENFLGNVVIMPFDSIIDALWYEKAESFDSLDIIGKIPENDAYVYRKQYRRTAFFYTENKQNIGLLIGMESAFKDRIHIIKGDNLSFAGPFENELLISSIMADNLEADVDDIVAIEIITKDGRRNFDYFIVKGIYKIQGTTDTLIGHIALTAIEDIRYLVGDEQNMVTEILIHSESAESDTVLKSILTDSGYKILDWQQYGSFLVGLVNGLITIIGIVGVIMVIVITVFFFDTMLSMVEERKREYGIMMSMGLSTRQVIAVLFYEMAIFVSCFVLPGIIFGGIIIALLAQIGLPLFSDMIQNLLGGFEKIIPFIEIKTLCFIYIAIFLVIEIIGLTFVFKINKLNPVEVLKNE